MFKLIIKLISDLIGPVNLKKSLVKQIGPNVLLKFLLTTTSRGFGLLPLQTILNDAGLKMKEASTKAVGTGAPVKSGHASFSFSLSPLEPS